MEDSLIKKLKAGKIPFLLSILILIFWAIAKNTNVYTFKITGSIFEMLWLPMVVLYVFTPLSAACFWRVEKYTVKSFNFLAMVVFVITTALLFA
jgi:hypothetical protein